MGYRTDRCFGARIKEVDVLSRGEPLGFMGEGIVTEVMRCGERPWSIVMCSIVYVGNGRLTPWETPNPVRLDELRLESDRPRGNIVIYHYTSHSTCQVETGRNLMLVVRNADVHGTLKCVCWTVMCLTFVSHCFLKSQNSSKSSGCR